MVNNAIQSKLDILMPIIFVVILVLWSLAVLLSTLLSCSFPTEVFQAQCIYLEINLERCCFAFYDGNTRVLEVYSDIKWILK